MFMGKEKWEYLSQNCAMRRDDLRRRWPLVFGVTDKAVSRERGLSYPDIELLDKLPKFWM